VDFEAAANGMIGLESALPLVLELVRDGVLSPMDALAKLTSNPAEIMGLPLGALRGAGLVHLTIIDPDAEYLIDTSTFQSKSRNCPFHGRSVRGQVLMTMVDGCARFTRPA
jgi:dihydroorotase